ncbi:MAG: radical SAM family heme chaperone HemW [Robiginitomaculum sp.]|nr:radical SAM family heme chaperone HemW [Robiginitomaculum sp.]
MSPRIGLAGGNPQNKNVLAGGNPQNISLYVHWPYCTRICPYCDFNVYKNKGDNQAALVAAILDDMRYGRDKYGPRRLAGLHFGGGTPSLLTAKNLGLIIDLAVKLWSTAQDIEIGLEANPNDITEAVLRGWCQAGIERVSIGVQSFDTDALLFLGRDHDAQQAQIALKQAVDIIPRVSADLIYGRIGQSARDWARDLRTAIDTGVGHISAYQLTIEKSTAFGRAELRGNLKAVDDDQSADLYETGIEILSSAGFNGYEVSNFAKTKGQRSRHNLAYWTGADYLGLGPGAHGRMTYNGERTATICALKPQDYIDHIQKFGHGVAKQEILNGQSWGQEYLLMGLRISAGISLSKFEDITGRPLNPDTIELYVKAKLLKHKNDRLAATPKGRLVLDRLSHELLLG